ncbi:FAD-dependent oxidoreductase [Caballeronia sp. PC1]|nr:FAD-dependent oxidoreductase [Caballeronia sp. PC1]MCE4544759.1 FAD-dependent oxidoreductase [Caballeronia sp. PC1]
MLHHGDATGDIHKFTRGLADACARRGVIFKFGAAVRRVEIQNRICTISLTDDESGRPIASQTADAIVVCAGVESREIARKLGEKVNIYPVKGYSITVNLRDEQSRTAAPSVSLLDDAAKIVTSRLGPDRFRVAGTAEFNGFNLDIRADRIRPLLRWSERLFPKMDTDSVTPWAGLRPMTPDMLPVVRPGECVASTTTPATAILAGRFPLQLPR